MLALLIPLVALFALLGGALLAERARFRLPTLTSFVVCWCIAALAIYLGARDAVEPTRRFHSWSPAIRSAIVGVVGMSIYLGIVAVSFAGRSNQSTRFRLLLTLVIAIPAFAIAFFCLLYVNCMADLGCV